MPKVGGKRKKARTHKEDVDPDETSTGQKIAKTLILKRGDIPNPLKTIIGDMREVMYPHTAMKLRESSKNRLKDYMQISSGFGVSHLVLFSATKTSNYLKLVKLPEGPTITFKIMNYSSHKDVLSSQKKPRIFGRTLASPLLILNGFNNINPGEPDENRPSTSHYNLAYLMMQNMFPPLDLAKAKIYNTKKTVLFNLDPETDLIDFRYYGLKATQTGLNKNIKQLLEAKKLPNMKGFKDISEYILRENDYMSENEIEDTLDEDVKSKGGNKASNKMTVKLYEIGPRLTLKLIKIEEGLLKGSVVYHRIVQKTTAEIEENRKKVREKAKQKEKLRKKQLEIVNEKLSKKFTKDELKKKKEFLEEQADEEVDENEDGEYNKEMDEPSGLGAEEEEVLPVNKRKRPSTKGKKGQEEEEEEKIEKKQKKAYDLSKGGIVEDIDEEDNINEDDEVEEDDENNLPDEYDEYD